MSTNYIHETGPDQSVARDETQYPSSLKEYEYVDLLVQCPMAIVYNGQFAKIISEGQKALEEHRN